MPKEVHWGFGTLHFSMLEGSLPVTPGAGYGRKGSPLTRFLVFSI